MGPGYCWGRGRTGGSHNDPWASVFGHRRIRMPSATTGIGKVEEILFCTSRWGWA